MSELVRLCAHPAPVSIHERVRVLPRSQPQGQLAESEVEASSSGPAASGAVGRAGSCWWQVATPGGSRQGPWQGPHSLAGEPGRVSMCETVFSCAPGCVDAEEGSAVERGFRQLLAPWLQGVTDACRREPA